MKELKVSLGVDGRPVDHELLAQGIVTHVAEDWDDYSFIYEMDEADDVDMGLEIGIEEFQHVSSIDEGVEQDLTVVENSHRASYHDSDPHGLYYATPPP